MTMSTDIRGVTGTQAGVDANNNLLVNLPINPVQAGSVQIAHVRDATTARVARVTEEGEQYQAVSRLMFHSNFNNPGALINTQFDQTATTMALAANTGFMRFNSGAITTITTGIAIRTWRSFSIEDGSALRFKFHLRTTGGAVANKQIDAGIGYANPAAGQGAAMNEFIGFRWTTAGNLVGVLEYSTGGAPVSTTVNINGGVPYADNVTREYEVIITDNLVEFWVNNVYVAQIVYGADAPGLLKGNAYPIFLRLFNSGSAPASAPIVDLGDVSVLKVGFAADIPMSYRQALMGRHFLYNQPGLGAANGSPFVTPTSGTAPTSATGSNTATTFTGLGGFYRENGAAIGLVAHSNVIVSAYQNPAVPTAAGAGNDVRNMVITDIVVNPIMVSAVLTAQVGAINLQWFIAVGATAISLATADAAGTTAPGTKAPRIFPLPMNDGFASAPVVGVVGTRIGNSQLTLGTPLVVHPGEFVVVGFRVMWPPTTAATAGSYDGSLALSGYWD